MSENKYAVKEMEPVSEKKGTQQRFIRIIYLSCSYTECCFFQTEEEKHIVVSTFTGRWIGLSNNYSGKNIQYTEKKRLEKSDWK